MPTIPEGEICTDAEGNFIMSPETLKSLTDYVEESENDEGTKDLKGRKDYCCHNNEDGRCKVIRASNSASAAIKCMAHYAGRPVTSHRGNCNH
jgi:hypothetical protein